MVQGCGRGCQTARRPPARRRLNQKRGDVFPSGRCSELDLPDRAQADSWVVDFFLFRNEAVQEEDVVLAECLLIAGTEADGPLIDAICILAAAQLEDQLLARAVQEDLVAKGAAGRIAGLIIERRAIAAKGG